jgi:hypothetical protein
MQMNWDLKFSAWLMLNVPAGCVLASGFVLLVMTTGSEVRKPR